MSEGVRISGFMVARNLVRQGYPFLEAIVAALAVCDEVLVSEGYSSDETWEALQWLAARFPGRVRLWRDEWRVERRHRRVVAGEVIAAMQNVVLERCTGDYCLSFQANEVLHENAADELRALPHAYPGVEIFDLPFSNVLGSHILWMVDMRKRLFRNRPHIRSMGDGYDVGFDRRHLWTHPRELWDFRRRGGGVRTYVPREPFYRYGALCPYNYVLKLETRKELYHASLLGWSDAAHAHLARSLRESEERGETVRQFWERGRVFFDTWKAGQPPEPGEHHPRRTMVELETMPRVMAHLRDRWRYDLQASMDALSTLGPATDPGGVTCVAPASGEPGGPGRARRREPWPRL